MHRFSLSKRFYSSLNQEKKKIQKVGVIGLGLMGHGIVQTAASAGFNVVGIDSSQSAIDNGMKRIEGSLNKLLSKQVEKGKMDQKIADDLYALTRSRIETSSDRKALQDCDLIIEAIIEDMTIKTPLYKELGSIVKPSCIFASNTSSLPIQNMADVSGRPDRTIGLHFFNPVQLMKLVEVVRTDQTNPEVLDIAKTWVQSIGKTPVSCKDTPGFIVNRLLVPNIAQSLLMLDRGDATKEDIDVSMKLGAGYPMGPITLADYVGLDTCLSILQGWVENYPNEPAFVIPKCLEKMVKAGKLGRKSGEGFYKWNGDKVLS